MTENTNNDEIVLKPDDIGGPVLANRESGLDSEDEDD